MTLQIFPYVFGRLGGASFDVLTPLESPEIIDLMDELQEQIKIFDDVKRELNAALYTTISHLTDTKTQNLILALKRNIYNDRKINFCEYGDTIKGNDIIATLLCKHFLIQQRIDRLRALIDKNHTSVIQRSMTHVSEISRQHFLKNGLIFSSTTMFDKVALPTGNSMGTMRKKDLNLAMSLLRYITRSVAKTSPFSSFNSIFAMKWANGHAVAVKPDFVGSNFSVNNLIFLFCKKVLLGDALFTKRLRVFLNPTLHQQQGELSYFVNNDNHEIFSKVKVAALIKYVVNQLGMNECITYEELVNKIQQKSGEALKVAFDCVNHLMGAGLVVIHFPVSIKDKHWPKALLALLQDAMKGNESSDMAHAVSSLLRSLISTSEALKLTSDAGSRKNMIDDVYIDLTRHIDEITKQSNVSDLHCIVKKLLPENLFYEDVTTDSVHTYNIADWKDSLSHAGKLFGRLQNAALKKEIKKLIAEKLASTYNGKAVPVLKYYQEQYALNNTLEEAYGKYECSLTKNWSTFFQALPALVGQNEIDLSHYLPQHTDDPHLNLDLFSQVAVINGKHTLVVNNMLNGIATNISRFASLYPANIVCDIKQTLKSIYKTGIVAELIDASVHNTNSFPGFADHIIDTTLHKNHRQRNIDLRDLLICLDRDDNHNVILANTNGRQVVPIDFSMESISGKSRLMKFLDIFGPANSESTLSFLDLYENVVLQLMDFESTRIAKVPRLYCSDRIVFSRKKWFIKGEMLHQLLNHNSPAYESFISFDTWRKKISIPQHIFVRSSVKTINRSKPQYINLSAPLMFALFRTIALKCDGADIIELTEMLPAPEHLTTDKKGNRYVSEYIFGLYNLG